MGTFSAVGVSPDFFVAPGNTLQVTISNTFVATVVIERAISGAYVPLYTITGDQVVALPIDGTFRLNCTDYTSGTVTYALASQAPANPYLPPGGTTGQALEKTSNAPGVADWETVVGSGLFGAKTIVVSTGGNDAAGTASKYAAEFLTIAAALAAAASGDTIVIRPGSYAPAAQLTLKAGVGLHFMLGAQVTAPAGSVIFYDGGASIAARITGDGTFICTSVSFLFDLSNASVDFEAMDIPATTTAPLISFSGNGSLRARVKSAIVTHGDILNTGNSSPVVLISAPSIQANQRVVYIGGAGAANVTIEADQSITGGQILVDSGSAGATRVSITAPTITQTAAGNYGIYLAHAAAARYDICADVLLSALLNQMSNAACELHIDAKTIAASAAAGTGSAFNFYSGSKTFISCEEFSGVAGAENPIYMEGASVVHLMRGRIRGLDGSASGNAISTHAASLALSLYPGVVLIAGNHASTKSIAADNAPTVVAMGAIAANKAADVAVVIAVGSLLVDAAVV